MRVCPLPIPLVFSAATSLILGVTGCAPKAVKAPPTPVTSPAATAPGEISPPSPSSPSVPTPHVLTGDLVPSFFGFDSSILGEEARVALDKNARLLRDQPDIRVTIEGHCDERGTAEYNQALGERRALAARDYLIAAGVAGTRISIVSYGKERPFDERHSEAAWASNRRAHLVVQ